MGVLLVKVIVRVMVIASGGGQGIGLGSDDGDDLDEIAIMSPVLHGPLLPKYYLCNLTSVCFRFIPILPPPSISGNYVTLFPGNNSKFSTKNQNPPLELFRKFFQI